MASCAGFETERAAIFPNRLDEPSDDEFEFFAPPHENFPAAILKKVRLIQVDGSSKQFRNGKYPVVPAA